MATQSDIVRSASVVEDSRVDAAGLLTARLPVAVLHRCRHLRRAKLRYRSGVAWHVEEHERPLFEIEQAERYEGDVYEDKIAKALEFVSCTTMEEIKVVSTTILPAVRLLHLALCFLSVRCF